MKGLGKARLVLQWGKSRGLALGFFAAFVVVLFVVYGLYGYAWGTAVYTAVVGAAVGLGFAVVDFIRFASAHSALAPLPGRFPTTGLPEARELIGREYTEVIDALERRRVELEAENERVRRDADQYYTLWVHQIKTPISAMGLLLQRGEEPDREALEAQLFAIEQYVGMVLQYQRLASLNADLVLRRHEVEGLVKQAVKNLAPLFIRKKLPLALEGLEGQVVTDEKWFVFVVEQLLTNALKYTSAGRVAVYSRPGPLLVIEDTGVGIRAEDLPRVFERGFTGTTGREDQRATGLGLYLSREILTRLGLSVAVESRRGEGTKVTLDLSQQQYDQE